MSNLMLLFGSGGHSSEMLMLIQNAKLKDKLRSKSINKVICVISEDDTLIEEKLNKELPNSHVVRKKLHKVTLKRARKVGQTYISAIWTFILGLMQSLHIVMKHKPNLCLTNGPAISVTIALAIRCLQLVTLGFYYRCLIIYIESFCRTRTLSLSGKLIYHLRLTNEFYVQWPDLCDSYPRAKYKGLLV